MTTDIKCDSAVDNDADLKVITQASFIDSRFIFIARHIRTTSSQSAVSTAFVFHAKGHEFEPWRCQMVCTRNGDVVRILWKRRTGAGQDLGNAVRRSDHLYNLITV